MINSLIWVVMYAVLFCKVLLYVSHNLSMVETLQKKSVWVMQGKKKTCWGRDSGTQTEDISNKAGKRTSTVQMGILRQYVLFASNLLL